MKAQPADGFARNVLSHLKKSTDGFCMNLICCEKPSRYFRREPIFMASCGHADRQSQQFVQLDSAGRVPMSQMLVHLSQSLHASVLYTLNSDKDLKISNKPPVGQTNLHQAFVITIPDNRKPRTINVLTSHIRFACSNVNATDAKKSPTRIGTASRGCPHNNHTYKAKANPGYLT